MPLLSRGISPILLLFGPDKKHRKQKKNQIKGTVSERGSLYLILALRDVVDTAILAFMSLFPPTKDSSNGRLITMMDPLIEIKTGIFG